jgi:multiple sugar transport system ATP-binding protein
MSSIKFEYVSKKFGDFVAVNNLNLDIQAGEFLVFVGPSGCGKTTSLRMLAGLENVTEGYIYIGDRLVNDLSPKERDIAMVFQSYALYPHMSVYGNMAFSLQLQGKRQGEIQARVEAAAKQLQIEHLLHRLPKELSGGQRQRVAVGRAIVRQPKVFLMDEPLSNLDAKLRVEARTEISKLHQELGTTFVYVTHDQVEAMTMGSRIAVMKEGVLQQIDTPENLYNHPQNTFVAEFIGSPAMNFFPAKLQEKEGELSLVSEVFSFPIPKERRQCYQKYLDSEVILGIRPENIYDSYYLATGIEPSYIKAEVLIREMMGNEVILYLRTLNRENFVARVDPRSSVKVGETVEIVFDLQRFHLFNQATQEIISIKCEK